MTILPTPSAATPPRSGQPGTGIAPPRQCQAATVRKRPLTGKSREYRQLWRVVDGAVFDALYTHQDYLTDKGRRNARNSINKRVVGNLMGFVEQTKGRQGGSIATARADAAERVSSEATEASRTVPQYEAASKGRGVVGKAISRLFGLFRRKYPSFPYPQAHPSQAAGNSALSVSDALPPSIDPAFFAAWRESQGTVVDAEAR